jgi:hypothetical protein
MDWRGNYITDKWGHDASAVRARVHFQQRGNLMKVIKILSALLFALSLVGCTNLKGVRDFANESAKLSAYTELTTRFRDTYQREQPYLSGEAERLAQENDKRREAAYDDLLKIHQRVTFYMQTLAKLAGENAFDLSNKIDSLADGIKAYPDLGIDEKQVNAITNISKIITKWVTAVYQERAVRNMVAEGNPHLQTLLDGMAGLVRYYRKTNENEKNTVLGFFEVEIPFADTPKDRLLATLARAHLQSKTTEYRSVQRKYDEAEKGIRSIATGHQKLLENIDKLSIDEVESMISGFARDIKTIRNNLQELGN